MNQWGARTAVILLLGAALTFLPSCGGDPSQNPAIQQKFREIDEQMRLVAQLPGDFLELREEVDTLTDEITRLRSGRVGTTGTVAAVPPAELNAIKRDLAALKNTVQAQQAKITDLEKGLAEARSAARAPRPTPVNLRTGRTTPTPAAGGAETTRPTPTPTPAPTPRYVHYEAEAGDTLASVAEKFNITVDDLIMANTYLKGKSPDAPLVVGQRYWIPQK